MKNLKLLSVLVLLAFLGACTTVKSVNQLGKDNYILDKDEWEGTWIAGDGSLQLYIVDIKLAEIEIVFIEKGEIKKYQVFLRQNGKDSYMNLVAEDGRYYFAKYIKRKNQIITWLPSIKMLKTAISNRKLEGIINEEKDLLIKSDKNTLNKYFIENKGKMLFEYEEPFVFRKLVE
ncbi:MAG: hypothetical protein ACC650_10550 [Gammaproteobacteria bacterium]